ncbi:flagellar protein export ATPase FliI [Ferrovum sp.]|uniref:flagellar protein export ATPase FliI n=1 Tax=Ferrovum sp. TaxID=2609467 RepID=UPI0026242740|nr:flagellar protein export ATPase FliI [Ferrovum sp.]
MTISFSARNECWRESLAAARDAVISANPLQVSGQLVKATGLVMEAVGLRLPVGSTCMIELPHHRIEAEVVGFSGDRLFLMPENEVHGLVPGARVVPAEIPPTFTPLGKRLPPRRRLSDRVRHLPVGERLLGRVVDGAGRPLDALGPLGEGEAAPLQSRPINPLDRTPISAALDVGVRAINALLTVGRGQRMGLFAGSGVGKSVLLGMMARFTEADVIVVGMIGERGREVREFIDDILGTAGMARAVVVAAPADTSPLLRLQGAAYATTIAEYFRDRGQNVLLIMDSLTRYAMAQREIALAIGEPPATKGYPPSVFARLPKLVERAGNGIEGGGSITAFYTVLTEGDDQQDPIADSARAILDGHIVLSRRLAEQGHYPAIDVEASISRAMNQLVPARQMFQAQRFKQLYAHYQRNRDLVSVGAYVPGSDPLLDEAIQRYPDMEHYLVQGIQEQVGLELGNEQFLNLFGSVAS